jgi:hypothetical protein
MEVELMRRLEFIGKFCPSIINNGLEQPLWTENRDEDPRTTVGDRRQNG